MDYNKMDNVERKTFILFRRSLAEVIIFLSVVASVIAVKIVNYGVDSLHYDIGNVVQLALYVIFLVSACMMTRDKKEPTWAIVIAWIGKVVFTLAVVARVVII